MKEWNSPEMKELSLRDTEYFALNGTVQDGTYTSNDGKYEIPTFSGPKNGDIFGDGKTGRGGCR
ncbi:hypothetical protein [Anaerosporobacter sp.]